MDKDLDLRPHTSIKRQLETVARRGTQIAAGLVVLLVVALISMIVWQGTRTFWENGVHIDQFLLGTVWNPHGKDAAGAPLVGSVPLLLGSAGVTLFSALIATPFALAAALVVVEIAPSWGDKIIRSVLEILVGIPSVVYGLIGLTVLVPWVRSWSGSSGYGLLSGSIILAIMIVPTEASLMIEALRAVPESCREAAFGLGYTKWQTSRYVVLPAALSGLVTALIMGMARAFGEALAVQMVIGNAPAMPDGFFSPAATLTSILTMSMGNETFGTLYSDVLWSLALMLLVISLAAIMSVRAIEYMGEKRYGSLR